MRLVVWGWSAAIGLGLAATTVAREVSGHFGDHPILIRPWMQGYNLALGLTHLLALLLLVVGTTRLPSSREQKGALAALGLAVLAVLAMLLFPLIWGAGPFFPDGREMRALRALVFAPSLFRAVGCALLAVALFRSHTASYVIVALLSIDVLLVAWKWGATPKAVMVCVHPFCAAPLGLLPWLGATVAFAWAMRERA